MKTIVTIIVIVGIIWAIGIFFGAIGGIGKSFKPTPHSTLNSSRIEQQHKEQMETTEERRKRFMEDVQQKMRDQAARR